MKEKLTKSKQALMDSFLELMSQESYKSITIQNICKKAHIRRSTFYNHFASKDELYTFTIHHYLHRLEEIIIKPQEVDTPLTSELKELFYQDTLTVLELCPNLTRLLSANLPDSVFQTGFLSIIRNRIKTVVLQHKDGYKIPFDLVIDIYTNIAVQALSYCVNQESFISYKHFETYFEWLLRITKSQVQLTPTND